MQLPGPNVVAVTVAAAREIKIGITSFLKITVIMQITPLGRHNLQTASVFENYLNYPRNKMKTI